jgi:hypothetical protein
MRVPTGPRQMPWPWPLYGGSRAAEGRDCAVDDEACGIGARSEALARRCSLSGLSRRRLWCAG